MIFMGPSMSETKNDIGRVEQSSLAKQSKNAMMSSISPREEESRSKMKKNFKTLFDKRMTLLLTSGLLSILLIWDQFTQTWILHLDRGRR